MFRPLTLFLSLALSISAAFPLSAVDVSVRRSRMSVREVAKLLTESTGKETAFDDDALSGSSVVVSTGVFSVDTFVENLSKAGLVASLQGGVWQIAGKPSGNMPSSISGRVLYENGEPLSGATVMIPGTMKGTMTDASGRYTLALPQGCYVAKVVFMGMNDRIIQIAPGKNQPDITLSEAATALDELVFVGYSTMAKRDVLGSITSLRSDEMQLKSTGGDILTAMKGKVAGMNIVANSGEPGAGSQITLRGASSISGSGAPLYIIDGVPMEIDNVGSLEGDASFSPLANFNLSDIESVEVLKDAASAAIYGSRASNGVVIITTKGGELGHVKPSVSFSHVSTLATLYRKLDVMTSDQYRSAFIDAMINYKGEYPTNDWVVNPTHPYHANSIDWQDLLFRPAYQTKNNFSLRGSSPDFSYNISLGYKNQQPIVIETDYVQYNVSGKFTYRITNRLKGGTNVYYTNTDYDRIISSSGNNMSALRAALTTNPTVSPYDPYTGELLDWLGTSGQGGRNPIAMAKKAPYNFHNEWTLLSQWLELTLAKGLTLRSSLSLDCTSLTQDFYRPANLASTLSAQKIDSRQYSESHSKQVVNENTLSYHAKKGKHSFGGVLGQSIQTSVGKTIKLNGEIYVDSNVIPIQSAQEQTAITQTVSERHMVSFFGRGNYSYDGRYLVSLVLRADGSSRFGPDKRFGYFPSASLGWRFSEEPFLKNLKGVLSEGKIRASYGVTGNQNVGNYDWRGAFTTNDSKYDGVTAIKQTGLQNYELGWETTTQINFGLDLGFWNDRLALETDVYDKVSDDLLFSFPLNTYTGFSSVSRNYGSIENKGIEFNLRTVNISRSKFSWRSDFNIAFNKNKIISLPDNEDFIVGTYSLGRVGEAAGVFYAHSALGIYQYTTDNVWYGTDGTVRPVKKGSLNGDPFVGGDVIWEDLDGNGIIDDDDRKIIGSPHPIFFGGVGNTFSFGDFSLAFHFDFTYGNKIMNELRRSRNQLTSAGNLGADALKRWRQEGDVTDFPRLVYGDRMENFRPSTLTMEDGSFLRLSNLSLSYQVPSSFLSKLKIKSMSVYVSGTNLLIWSNYSGYDPEISSSTNPFMKGIDNGSFPKSRTANLGIDLNF